MNEYGFDYNQEEPWEKLDATDGHSPVDEGLPYTPYRQVYQATDTPKPKKRKLGGLIAFGLACLLAGGAGVYGVTSLYQQSQAQAEASTTLLQGDRTATTALSVAQVSQDTQMTLVEIYETYVGSTVGIATESTTMNAFGQVVSQAASGSGFVITEDGYIVTNNHVIDGADQIQVTFVDGASYEAVLVGSEPDNDIAVLKIEATGLTPVVLGDSDDIKVGEAVAAIGNPLGELTFSLTDGIISARDRTITFSDGTAINMLQTNTAINSGNSGGPLFDMYGQVIGINSAKMSSSSSSDATVEGLGFAIPMNDVIDMIQDIIENGYVTGKPYMGISVTTVPEADALQYGLSQGALVRLVEEGSCAELAGLQVGDIITALGDTTVLSADELIATKNTYSAGDTVALTVQRSGAEVNLTITFDEETPVVEETTVEEQVQPQQQQQSQQYQQINPFSELFPW